jgi:DNA-binding HxlR family transcriptional regulator
VGEVGKGYGQYCPISRALDLLGERWTMLVVRDLLVGATRFNELARGLPGLSRSLLSKRLRQLETAGIVERLDGEYLLTPAGKALEPIVFGLGEWGAQWTFGDPDPDELDAQLLVWWMHTRLDTSHLPGRRLVLQVRFTDDPRRFWIVIESGTPSVCLADPGYEVDVAMVSDVATLYRVWLGRTPLRDAIRAGSITFEGPSALVRRMPEVMQLSPVAEMVRART